MGRAGEMIGGAAGDPEAVSERFLSFVGVASRVAEGDKSSQRGGRGSSRGQDRGPQIIFSCRMVLTSSGEHPSHSP